MTTATKRRLPAIDMKSEYHKANARAIERGQAIMSGQPDPGPLMTDDDMLAARGTIELIPIEHLGQSPYQPRIGYDAATIAELAASLKAAGRNHTDLIVRLVTASAVISARTRGRVLPKTKYEVLDGHRRLLAGQQAGLTALWCKVVELDDAAARRLCREANLNREDLKPLERLYALRDMLKDGDYASQAELAAAQGITPAALSNQLRVLELPHEWTELISQEKLTATHLRALVPWKDRPAVLAAARAKLDHDYNWGLIDGNGRMPTVKEWEDAVLATVKDASRPIKCDKNYFYESHHKGEGKQRTQFAIQSEDVPFPKTIKTHRDELQIDDIKGLGERAFNVAKWDELSKADKLTRKANPDKTPSRPKAQALTPAEQKLRDKQNAEQLAKRLYRYKLAWLQKAIVARMSDASAATLLTHVLMFAASEGHGGLNLRHHDFGEAVIACGGTQKSKRHGYMNHTDVWGSLATLANSGEGVDLSGLVRTALAAWYQHDFAQSSSDVPPDFLEGAAAHLGIDFAKEWKLDREFLELHNHQQLVALNREWQLKSGNLELMKRAEVIDNLVSCVNLVRLPACLAKLKPVSLF